MKVLVVDDEEAISGALCDALKMYGHECFTADTVKLAVEKICERRPDLILLDLVLRSGYSTDFIYKTKEILAGRLPRIIIVSASNKAKGIAEEHGVEFLAKPFDLEVLENLIENDPQADQHAIPSEYWEGRCSDISSKEGPNH